MAEIIVTAEGTIGAPAEDVYRYISDYRQHHPRFLPPTKVIACELLDALVADGCFLDRARIEPVDDKRLDGRRVVLYLGRIAQSRRSEFLLDVAAQLRVDMPDVLLVMEDHVTEAVLGEIRAAKASHVVLVVEHFRESDLMAALECGVVAILPRR